MGREKDHDMINKYTASDVLFPPVHSCSLFQLGWLDAFVGVDLEVCNHRKLWVCLKKLGR